MYSNFVPLSVPSIQGNEWKYIKECIDTEWVSSAGKYVDRFEKDICELTGAKAAVACVNGTAALQVALKVIGVKADDEVLVPTLTFIAPINAVSYLGANSIFMDCDQYYNIDVEKTIEFIHNQTVYRNNCIYNKKTGKRVAAIITVHVFGNAVNIFELIDICRERNIKIIEDAAESIGTYYCKGQFKGKYTGTIGDIGCYSFNGNKIITTGGGGMIVTNDSKYAQKAKYLTTQAKDDPIYYIHNEVGYNFRLTNVQAALGVAQLEKLQSYIEIKKQNYKFYKQEVDKILGLKIAEVPDYANSNYWFYCLQTDESEYGMNNDELLKLFRENNIQTRPIWQLNHLQKPYINFQNYKIEKAYKLLNKTLNIPCSVNIKRDEIKQVIKVLKSGTK